MQFFIAIDGKKSGPFSLYRVMELLRDGSIAPDALGWHQGQSKWTPLRQMPALEGTIEELAARSSKTTASKTGRGRDLNSDFKTVETAPRSTAAPPSELTAAAPPVETKKIVLAHEVRPLSRFWARFFDYMLVYLVIWWIAGLPIPEGVAPMDWVSHPEQYHTDEDILRFTLVTFAAFAIWHGIEAVLIHAFGSTPGKALFSIRISRVDGERISLGNSLGRSYYVWLAGFGLGIFPFQILAMTLGFFRLLSTGLTLWDKHLRLYVRHTPMGTARILLAVAAFAVLMALQQLVFT